MDLGLKDKIVLVAGASRGLGAATVREFAREGAKVIMAARNREALLRLQESIFLERPSEKIYPSLALPVHGAGIRAESVLTPPSSAGEVGWGF